MKKFIILLSIALAQVSQAAFYPFHPSSPLYLGGGYNPYNPNEGYLECVDYDGTKALDTPKNRELFITVSQVKSRKDFYSKTDFSASVSASYGPFSGSGSISKMDEVTFNENDFNWVVVIKSNMGRWGLVNPRLKKTSAELSSDQLFVRCGSEIVTQQSVGVMIYALVTVHNVSQSERHELESKIGGGYKNVAFSADVSAKYKSIVEFSYAVGTVSMLVEAFGGEGIKKFADIVGGGGPNDFANFEKLPDLINAYVKDFDPQNAIPLDYTTTSLAAFKTGLPARVGDFNSTEVGAIYVRYIDSVKTLERIDSLLSPNNSSDITLSDSQRTGLEEARKLYQNNLNVLYSAGVECFNEKNNSQCRLPLIKDMNVVWPKSDINKICARKREDALAKNYMPYEYYLMAVRRNLVPIIDFTQNGILGVVGYNKCAYEY